MPRILAAAILLLAVPAARAERWKLQYFYDQERSSLQINDLQCPTAQRCIAAGFVGSEKGAPRPNVVVSSDGGAHWALVPLREIPISLFFLDESNGWIVGIKSLWKTIEGGRSWQRVGKLPMGTARVWFLDATHGFAVGANKSVHETTDGGAAWKPVPAAATPKTTAANTTYNWIDFVGKTTGVITGSSRPPRHDRAELPDWIDPEKAVSRRQWPTISITLDTRDGGKTWVPATASLFGQITRVRMLPDGIGLGLITFGDSFEYPSEVFRVDWKAGKSTRVFRDHNRAITDVAIVSPTLAYLAGEEVTGKLRQSPIPGKLKIYKSNDLSTWSEMEVDYRATAVRAVLSAPDAANVWVATDTGMILKLVR